MQRVQPVQRVPRVLMVRRVWPVRLEPRVRWVRWDHWACRDFRARLAQRVQRVLMVQ